MQELNASSDRETQREVEELLADARQRALQTVRQANELASAETRATERELRKQLVAQVVDKARTILSRKNNSELDAARRRHAATQLSQALQ